MSTQTTSRIVMIRPAAFGFNEETATNNTFQKRPVSGKGTIIEKAVKEFDRLVELLRQEGVEVEVIQDTDSPAKPDAIFPNNWISFHESGLIVTYPMFSPLRRAERRMEIIESLGKQYIIKSQYALEAFEAEEKFLEGTGSMVLDRENKIAYACLSPRTNPEVLDLWCKRMSYTPFTFYATYDGQEVYHTNVIMAIGDGISVACVEIVEKGKQEDFRHHLTSFGRDLVELTRDQIGLFAGNMLALRNHRGEQIMVMSETAHVSLSKDQISGIETHARIVSSDIATIETIGGGSVRCMIAENFLRHI